MIAHHIKQKIADAVKSIGASVDDIQISHPENPDHGNYATNVAFQLNKQLQKPPFEIAQQLAAQIKPDELIEKAEAVKPAFINIHLKQEALIKEMLAIQKNDSVYGKAASTGKKIMMEFGQPNTHKLPHIGHLFSYIYGESMARIFEYQGNEVFRANYQGDIGLHVAKCLWQVLKDEQAGAIPRDKSLEERCKYLQKCYQAGATAYEESEEIKKEIDELNKKIYVDDPSIHDLWQETRQWSVDFYKTLEERLGVFYKKWYFETMSAPVGKQTVLNNVGTIFEKDAEAIIFRGEKYGQHTRVFINKFGNPTYEGKDTGLIQLKKNDFDFDRSFTSTAIEQKNYWDTVITACELLFPELKGKLNHIDFGMIQLSTGKMSSRTGNIIDAIGLIEMVKTTIKEHYPEQPDDVVEKVAQASIKYSFLKGEVYKNKSFDLKTSVSNEGDSGPYLLYSYVRCQSVLKNQNVSLDIDVKSISVTDEELAVLRLLYQFPEAVLQSANVYSQHFLAMYLFDLSQKFNLFYQKNPILKSDVQTKQFRLLLTQATANILKKGLYLLGIETVEKM